MGGRPDLAWLAEWLAEWLAHWGPRSPREQDFAFFLARTWFVPHLSISKGSSVGRGEKECWRIDRLTVRGIVV